MEDDLPLSGRVALVTGGARGIGAATCRELGRLGADIAVVDIKLGGEADAVAKSVEALGRGAVMIQADVASVADCRRMVEKTVAHFGRLDVLVNNAGGGFGYYTPFEQESEEQFDHVVGVNLKGAFFGSQAAVPHLQAGGRGRIINIASELVYIGDELLAAYTAAKGGIVALTRSMARALAPEITVNVVVPGPTATERFKTERWYSDDVLKQIPLGKFGTPEDVARSISFLAGPGGDHYTGQTLNVNGGFVMA